VTSPARLAAAALLDVALARPVAEVFTYRGLPGMAPLPVGTQVVVPFGGRKATGFVVGHPERPPVEVGERIRAILEIVGEGPALDEGVLELCRWAASYYLTPLGEVLCAALPVGERAAASRRLRLTAAGRGVLEGNSGLEAMALDPADRELLARVRKARSLSQAHLTRSSPASRERTSYLVDHGFLELEDKVKGQKRQPAEREGDATLRETPGLGATAPPLNAHQTQAFEALREALAGGRYATFLLQGITGSGKTEVYLRVIAEARRRGRGALVLVPEIALTPQLAARFRARFGDDVAVLHSGIPPGERLAAWRRLRRGEVGIALGARSAIFAPVRDLAIIVVDEEHDGSFKQEEGFRYHARDLAVMRARQGSALAVLGSATPCLETYRNALLGRFTRLLLPVRANPAAAVRPLPGVEVVDLRRHPPGDRGILSPPLVLAVRRALEAGEQSILFLNRRGFSTVVHCQACGFVLGCDACSVSLTLHRTRGLLVCHYCGRADPVRQLCPRCKRPALTGMGSGTERVESQVRELFPGARVARLDRDTASGRGRVEEVLARVGRGELDILIGTQMVTKGHDFGNVTLVGILQPDQGIHLPDFRAAERTFALMEQVAGRAGRGERPGRIVLQTWGPEHPAIRFLVRHDYEGFVRDELGRREAAGYPPFARMVVLRLDGKQSRDVEEAAHAVAGRAREVADGQVQVLGPSEAPIPRLRGRARFQVWLSGTDRGKLLTVSRATQSIPLSRDVRLAVDVDPQSVL